MTEPIRTKAPLVDRLWRFVPATLVLIALLWVYILAKTVQS